MSCVFKVVLKNQKYSHKNSNENYALNSLNNFEFSSQISSFPIFNFENLENSKLKVFSNTLN